MRYKISEKVRLRLPAGDEQVVEVYAVWPYRYYTVVTGDGQKLYVRHEEIVPLH